MWSVNVDCKPWNGNWLTMRTVVMVLEIIGPNNNYPLCALASSGRLAPGTTNTSGTWQAGRILATN